MDKYLKVKVFYSYWSILLEKKKNRKVSMHQPYKQVEGEHFALQILATIETFSHFQIYISFFRFLFKTF